MLLADQVAVAIDRIGTAPIAHSSWSSDCSSVVEQIADGLVVVGNCDHSRSVANAARTSVIAVECIVHCCPGPVKILPTIADLTQRPLAYVDKTVVVIAGWIH